MPRILRPGAPGIYEQPIAPSPSLAGVRMDVAAFVGVAPRGPCRAPVVDEKHPDHGPSVDPGRPRRLAVPVAVESFDQYRQFFGGFEGQGALPYAVASFFDNGGRRAWIVRVVHDYGGDDEASAAGDAVLALAGFRDTEPAPVPPPVEPANLAPRLRAASEGRWGDRLRASLRYAVEPVHALDVSATSAKLEADARVVAGSLLRLADDAGHRELCFASDARVTPPAGGPDRHLAVTFDRALAFVPTRIEAAELSLRIDDGDGRVELHQGLGLSSLHPRWIASVLCWESRLLRPEPSWAFAELVPRDADLASVDDALTLVRPGADRHADLVVDDFFDESWVAGDPAPRKGVHAVAAIDEVATLVVPDLYWPGELPERDPGEVVAAPRSGDFEPCEDLSAVEDEPGSVVPEPAAPGLLLEPSLPADLERITEAQRKLVELAEMQRRFVVLLDVPPGLDRRRILSWRQSLRSSYAAAYHPWLVSAPAADGRDALVTVAPSAIAAGIIARSEHDHGLAHGPANALIAGVVDVAAEVAPRLHDELHQAGINVLVREPRGIRLSAARTLSVEPEWRQLSVRRLMIMIARALAETSQWLVFEPNGAALRAELRGVLRSFLRTLYRQNSFRGARESEAFFVRCDDRQNDQAAIDAGRIVAEVGVAPAEPLEFLVLRIERDRDGDVRVEAQR